MVSSRTREYCYNFFFNVFAILFAIFHIFYSIFGFCFLIIEKQYENCHLWLYNLISLVSHNVFLFLFPKNVFFLILWFTCDIFLCLFGGNQLFYASCKDSINKDFYTYGEISFVLQCLCILLIPIYFLHKTQKKERKESNFDDLV